MRILLTVTAAALLAAAVPAAHAATPATGDVSEAHLSQSWSGEADSQPLNNDATTETHQLCIQPFCDTFTLNVKDLGTALKVVFDAPNSAGFVDVLVTKPDGSTERFAGDSSSTTQEVDYDKAPVGNYTFDIWTNQIYGALAGPYDATATLCSATVARAHCFPPPPDDAGDGS